MTAVPCTRQTLPAIGSPNFASTSAIFLSVVFISVPTFNGARKKGSTLFSNRSVLAGVFVFCSIPNRGASVQFQGSIWLPLSVVSEGIFGQRRFVPSPQWSSFRDTSKSD
jgi:hypothetical protein